MGKKATAAPREDQPESQTQNGHVPQDQVDRPPPVASFRYGRVKSLVWANQTDRGIYYAVNLVRIYKIEGTDEWSQSSSLGRDDLLPAAEAARAAWHWIHSQMQGEAPF